LFFFPTIVANCRRYLPKNLLKAERINSNLANTSVYFSLRFGRKKVVVISLVVAAIANLIVTVIPDERDNTGDALEMVYGQ